MQIAIIGAGKVGRAVGTRWSAAGNRVVYGVRDPDDGRHTDLGRVATVAEAARDADLVLIALPWPAVREVLTGLGVGDAVVVDATNPLASGDRDRPDHGERSGAEQIAAWTGSARVVKAFNTTGSANMADPTYPSGTPVMLLAGDDTGACEVVAQLAAELGFEPVRAGGLDAASDLEHLAMIWIRLAYPLGLGPDLAFSLLRR
jgi:predicted dinucleotide-binding enzyme